MSSQQSILIVQRSSNLDGSAFSALLLADGLREAGWETHIAFGFEGSIIPRYKKAGHRTHIVPHDNWVRRGHSLRFVRDVVTEWNGARRFGSLIDTIHPDLIYVNTIVSLAGAVAARRRGVPCIWHVRELFADVEGEMRSPQWVRPLIPLILRHYGDKIIVNSKAVARNVLGARSEEKTIVVPNAAGKEFFDNPMSPAEACRHFGLSPEASIIGVPGTLRPMKGHEFFLRAVAPLVRKRTDFIIPITGGDQTAYAATLRALIQDIDLGIAVRFLGRVTNMPAFYRACDLVCIPSVAEPFGRTVIEAFASGTPVVATAVGGMKEIIDSGKTGLLVPYNDEEALASSLRHLLDAPDLRQKMSAKACQVAEEKYHESVYKQCILQVINDIIGT